MWIIVHLAQQRLENEDGHAIQQLALHLGEVSQHCGGHLLRVAHQLVQRVVVHEALELLEKLLQVGRQLFEPAR